MTLWLAIAWALGAVTGGFFTAWTLSLARLLSIVKAKTPPQADR